MSGETRKQAADAIVAVLPDRTDDLLRLQILAQDAAPTVTVIGKYNHGKSRLLNELIGQDRFAVADRRETVSLSDSQHDGVRWLDAPGLDADVGTEDDRHAARAAWLEADLRLFVHSAREGELDANERTFFARLCEDDSRTQRRTFFVLSQVDQLPDESELQHVRDALHAQLRDVPLHVTSSARNRKGIDDGKQLLLQKSGIPALRATLREALGGVAQARRHERALHLRDIHHELSLLSTERAASLDALRERQQRERRHFDASLEAVIGKVSATIEALLNDLGEDHASVPDSAKDVYGITAGKLERNRMQNAYSRACMEIDAVLIGHGVTALPQEQQVASNSLNSVMVAVMGISVKLRRDLRRIFCEPTGRQRMQQDFTRYFELSADRRKLAAQIDETQRSLAQSTDASLALRAFGLDV
ncbi:GTPase [Paraburkholderia sp. BCC1886]|uniref:GTPase n=1 Tax=Paraburkholderia sp. BCC1886 TaxID=2562670 RepID=UPI001182DCFF|nr:GTPase [Paraburkholderia sp. BCC1886]